MTVEKRPIKCPKCGHVVYEDERETRHLVLEEDVKCPVCEEVVINVPKVTY